MRLRSVLSLVGCVLALQATSPAYGFPGFGPVPSAGATTDEKGRYVIELGDTTIHGTLWLDENIDGIRQPSESVLAHELVLGSGVVVKVVLVVSGMQDSGGDSVPSAWMDIRREMMDTENPYCEATWAAHDFAFR